MSEQKPITKVPDGQTRFYTTVQKAPNAKGFVGYETVWKPFQKEVAYKTPKTPQGSDRAIARAIGAGRRRFADLQKGPVAKFDDAQWHCFTGLQYDAMSGQWQMSKLPVHRIVPGFELLTPRAA